MSSQDGSNGINISLREIYDTLQEVADNVKGIKPQLESLEQRVKDGEEALPMAKDALKLATEHDNNVKWLWRTVIGAALTGFISLVVGVTVLLFQVVMQDTEPVYQPQDVQVELSEEEIK